jgi:hypothetical protein
MKKPDEKILKAINSLRGNPDWEMIRQWAKDSLDEIFSEYTVQYRPDQNWFPFNSGRAFELKDLLTHLDTRRER